MSFWKNLFRDESECWKAFAANVGLHPMALVSLHASAGAWPKGLQPEQFSSSKWHELVNRVDTYSTMPYPLAVLKDTAPAPRPTYRISDDGRIARESNFHTDRLLFGCKPVGFGLDRFDFATGGDMVAYGTWKLIEHYSQLALARFVFSLPTISKASDAATATGKVIIVPEHLQVRIYMGVENTLFDVYEDLPEGGHITDKAVRGKLHALLNPAA